MKAFIVRQLATGRASATSVIANDGALYLFGRIEFPLLPQRGRSLALKTVCDVRADNWKEFKSAMEHTLVHEIFTRAEGGEEKRKDSLSGTTGGDEQAINRIMVVHNKVTCWCLSVPAQSTAQPRPLSNAGDELSQTMTQRLVGILGNV